MRCSGKVAIVTGGAMGIGQAIVRALLAEGASVVIADREGAAEAAKALDNAQNSHGPRGSEPPRGMKQERFG